eukprot:m.23976 g.23976  ORF g.23976 m.23976 type:complete len:268 (-) comp14434_c0_seq1:269-1072(-)
MDKECTNCGVEGNDLKTCGRCKKAWYCSVECQKAHWKQGGHKVMCGKSTTSTNAEADAKAASKSKLGLTNPCPMCLTNEDDLGRHAQCSNCGQLLCTDCRDKLEWIPRAKCPTCKHLLDVDAKKNVRQLLALVASTAGTGRHAMIAHCTLGDMYDKGDGVKQDHAKAVAYYQLSADQGYAEGQCNLGYMHQNGFGVPQSDTTAFKYYALAAAQGFRIAQFNIGILCATGQGVPKNNVLAMKHFKEAADQGHPEAGQALQQMKMFGGL